MYLGELDLHEGIDYSYGCPRVVKDVLIKFTKIHKQPRFSPVAVYFALNDII